MSGIRHLLGVALLFAAGSCSTSKSNQSIPDIPDAGDGAAPSSTTCMPACTAPPNSYCVDSTTLRSYENEGSCSDGQCTYAHTDALCGGGCASDACVGTDACNGVSCNRPPSASCLDANTLKTYSRSGTCAAGTCSYPSSTTPCANGCQDGACVGDSCAGVICDQPPAPSCPNDSTLRSYSSPGLCSAKTCSYAPTDTSCENGCADGMCKGDPCLGVICAQPPASVCVDASTLRTYALTGTCGKGACSYASTDTHCSEGTRCSNAQCSGVDEMSIYLGQSFGPDGSPRQGGGSVCFFHPGTPYTGVPTPVATSGPCQAFSIPIPPTQPSGGPTTFGGNAGTVTVHGGIVDPIVLSPSASSSNGCYTSNVPSSTTQIFADGALLSISGTGGADFPAFSTQVTAPPLIQISTSSAQRGAPLVVSWSPIDPGSKISIDFTVINADSTHDSYIFCNVDDTGSYTIPASLMQHMEPSSSVSYLRLDRNHGTQVVPASPSVFISAHATTTGERNLTYVP